MEKQYCSAAQIALVTQKCDIFSQTRVTYHCVKIISGIIIII